MLGGASTGPARFAEAADRRSERDVVKKSVVIAELLAGGGAEVGDVLRILDASAKAPASGRIHRIDRGTYVSVVEPHKGDRSHLVSQVQIYPQPGLALKFAALVSVLGKWSEIHRGQTSSVRFDFKGQKPKGEAAIFVQISSFPERPQATVLRISIRAPAIQ